VEQFRVAIVYGKSVKHQPQRVGLTHELADEDISMYLPTPWEKHCCCKCLYAEVLDTDSDSYNREAVSRESAPSGEVERITRTMLGRI
jgi:hypothetical protein